MKKFKVGDRVVAKVGQEPYFSKGSVGEIIVVGDHDLQVKFETMTKDDGEWFIHFDDAALYSSMSIVCLMRDGQPRPNENPVVHYDSDEAKAETDRLANVHAGQEFAVFERVYTAKQEYRHEWQRFAAGGDKAGAICELVKFGLMLEPANHAVNAFLKELRNGTKS